MKHAFHDWVGILHICDEGEKRKDDTRMHGKREGRSSVLGAVAARCFLPTFGLAVVGPWQKYSTIVALGHEGIS